MERKKQTTARPGYKHTKLGWIPEEWAIRTLNAVCDRITDGTHFSPKTAFFGDYMYITSRNIKEGFLDLSQVEWVTKDVHDEIYKRCDVQFGDVLLTKDGAKTGNACLNPLKEPFSLLSSAALLRASSKQTTNEYLLQWILSPRGQWQIRDAMAGQAITRITLETLRGFEFLFPPLPEQRRIAEVLGAWDRAIATAQQLLAAQQQRKRGLMQELLSGKKRFPGFEGKWKEVRLGELGDTYNGLSGKNGADFGEGKPYITYLNIFNNSRIDINQVDYVRVGLNERQSRVQRGDLFFTVSSETPDEVGMASVLLEDVEEMYLNSFCFGFRLNTFKVLLPEYARYYLRSIAFRRELNKLAQGATRFNLSKKQLVKISLFLPEVAEQRAIADCLSATEREIKTLNDQIVHLTTQKRGLMQVLLTGEKRLVVDQTIGGSDGQKMK